MKNVYLSTFQRFLLIILFIFALNLSSLPLNDFLEGESVNKEELIINTLSETLKNWYYQQRSNNFKDIVINVSLRDSFSHFVNNSRAEVVFFVHSTMIPKVTKEEVENAPFLRGM